MRGGLGSPVGQIAPDGEGGYFLVAGTVSSPVELAGSILEAQEDAFVAEFAR